MRRIDLDCKIQAYVTKLVNYSITVMLGGVLCPRLKPFKLSSTTTTVPVTAAYHNSRLFLHSPIPITFISSTRTGGGEFCNQRCNHTSACSSQGGFTGGAASIWHVIKPSAGAVAGGCAGGGERCELLRWNHHLELKGEGSWNVAWDARPARWLHRPDSAWLLFGVCECLQPVNCVNTDVFSVTDQQLDESETDFDEKIGQNDGFRVTGVLADGRCLFRAIAHSICLRCGEEAPDENRQRELADKLRAQVVDELLRRRNETEWFIEGDFDAYLKTIQKPYVWAGEPELMMASHVLKTPISVYMIERTTNGLKNIAKYGEEYMQNEESPIKVLFHSYGHYDFVETFSNGSHKEVELLKQQPGYGITYSNVC